MTSCPKCGSTEILHGECLKCGVILSKVHTPTSDSATPVSYVAPGDSNPPVKTHAAYVAGMTEPAVRVPSIKSDPLLRRIIWTLILILLLGGGYQLYRFVMHRAAAYAGYYRNGTHLFALDIPQEGWYHYNPSQLKATEFKEASDAFYRGSDPKNPNLVLAIWMEVIPSPVPDRLNESFIQQLREAIEREIATRMSRSGYRCEFTQSGRRVIGDNDGLFFHANLEKEGERLKTRIFCAFNGIKAYTIQFLGKDTDLIQFDSEVEYIINSFSFRISII